MRRSVVLTAALLAALALPSAASASERIVGGQPAQITDVPWQVALVHTTTTNVLGQATPQSDFQGQFCGGSLLDDTHVVTAAHCVTEDDDTVTKPGAFSVVAGIRYLYGKAGGQQAQPEATRQVKAVTAIDRFPTYPNDISKDDVAVLTLGSPISEGPTAKPIALGTQVVGGGTLLVSGWGSTQQKEDDATVDLMQYPEELRSLQVPFVADDACAADYGGGLDASSMLCAGGPAQDTCQGDSGGPAVQGGVLVGVTSFGVGCGSSHPYPGVYVELADPAVQAFVRQKAGLPAATPPASTTTTTATTPAVTTPAPTTTVPPVVVPPPPVIAPVAPPTPLVPPKPTITLRAGTKVDSKGRIAVRVRASADGAVSVRLRDASGRTLGRGSATLKAGTTKLVRVTLTKAARRTLRSRARAKGLKATLVVAGSSASAKQAVTLKR